MHRRLFLFFNLLVAHIRNLSLIPGRGCAIPPLPRGPVPLDMIRLRNRFGAEKAPEEFPYHPDHQKQENPTYQGQDQAASPPAGPSRTLRLPTAGSGRRIVDRSKASHGSILQSNPEAQEIVLYDIPSDLNVLPGYEDPSPAPREGHSHPRVSGHVGRADDGWDTLVLQHGLDRDRGNLMGRFKYSG
jgi:hypothetical protein